jgi:hypothetical protein
MLSAPLADTLLSANQDVTSKTMKKGSEPSNPKAIAESK